ncbi:MAG: hypothetical protein VXY16_04030 [Pseudomonadota bacterium]|nr:hypothetical protein [Pseudomonadota bacterium]
MKRIAGLFLAAALASTSAANASTTNFQDYRSMSETEQSQIVNGALARIYDGYSQQGRDDVNQCMVNLFLTAPTSGGLPVGYVEFAQTIALLNQSETLPANLPSIERIVFNIVSAHCVEQDIANTPDAPVITPPAPPATPG